MAVQQIPTPEHQTPPESVGSLPFEVLDVEKMDGPRTYRVVWRTLADDGYPEETSDMVEVPAGVTVEDYLESFLEERKQKRVTANVRARERREARGPDPERIQGQPAMLGRLKGKVDRNLP